MRRIPTMMASAGAAALTALVVSVATPAIGDDGGGGGTGRGTADAPKAVAPADRAADEQQLRSCLAGNGADVPAVGGSDLKRWIIEHQQDPATAAALKACHLVIGDHPAPGGCDGDGPAGKPGDKPGAEAAKAGALKALPARRRGV